MRGGAPAGVRHGGAARSTGCVKTVLHEDGNCIGQPAHRLVAGPFPMNHAAGSRAGVRGRGRLHRGIGNKRWVTCEVPYCPGFAAPDALLLPSLPCQPGEAAVQRNSLAGSWRPSRWARTPGRSGRGLCVGGGDLSFSDPCQEPCPTPRADQGPRTTHFTFRPVPDQDRHGTCCHQVLQRRQSEWSLVCGLFHGEVVPRRRGGEGA